MNISDRGHNKRTHQEKKWKKQLEDRLRNLKKIEGKPETTDLAPYAVPAAAGAATAAGLYWIISEGPRIVFPPRNLILLRRITAICSV